MDLNNLLYQYRDDCDLMDSFCDNYELVMEHIAEAVSELPSDLKKGLKKIWVNALDNEGDIILMRIRDEYYELRQAGLDVAPYREELPY